MTGRGSARAGELPGANSLLVFGRGHVVHQSTPELSRGSVRVSGDELRDPERDRDLEGGEQREAQDDQQHRVPRHSLFRLALGSEPGLLGPLFGSVDQAVSGLHPAAFVLAQRSARCHTPLVPTRARG